MATNLACIGMAARSEQEFDALIRELTNLGAEPVGDSLGVQSYAWQDVSGARVTYDLIAGVAHIMPTFAARTAEVSYTSLAPVSPDVTKMTVRGADGSETGVCCRLEQRRHLAEVAPTGQIQLAALGTGVRIFADESSFLASDASLLGTEGELGPPPPEVAQRGLAWPPRISPTAFLANGFYGPVAPTAHALMAGVVESVEPRVNTLTDEAFLVAQVRCAVGQLDVCLPDAAWNDLTAGSILTGTVAVTGRLVSEQEADRPRTGETRRKWRERTGRD